MYDVEGTPSYPTTFIIISKDRIGGGAVRRTWFDVVFPCSGSWTVLLVKRKIATAKQGLFVCFFDVITT